VLAHYLLTAVRHLRSHRLTSAINIACLTLGLVCFLAVYAVIAYLSRGDLQYPNASRIYMIGEKVGSTMAPPTAAWLTAEHLRADVPELESVARVLATVGVLPEEVPVATGDRKAIMHVTYADPEFLDVFALPFLAGDSHNALRAPRSAIVSASAAVKLFGAVDKSLGQTLRLQNGNEVTVRGVLDRLPQPSQLSTDIGAGSALVRFDVMFSMDVLEAEAQSDAVLRRALDSWGYQIFATYAVLPRDGSLTVDQFRRRLGEFGRKHADWGSSTYQFDAMNVADYRLEILGALTSRDKTGVSAPALFLMLGALVLIASCVNYANLATAQAAARFKEVGMRRAVGGKAPQVVIQFLIEAAFVASLALLAALTLTGIALAIVPGEVAAIVFAVVSTWEFWALLAGLLLAVTVCGGLYPALVLARVRPMQALRAGSSKSGGRFTQNVLVGAQFLTASVLLTVVLAMQSQNEALRHLTLSASAEPYVVVSNNLKAAGIDYEAFRAELLRQPHVRAATAVRNSPWVVIAGASGLRNSPELSARNVLAAQVVVNHDFFDALGIRVLAGRVFDRQHGEDDSARGGDRDTARVESVVVDQAFALENGWTEPAQAVGKTLFEIREDLRKPPLPRRVIGVVATRPMSIINVGAHSNMYVLDTDVAAYPIVRVSREDAASALGEIESVWQRFAPNVALQMRFADALVEREFQLFDTVGRVFSGVALLAFGIALLGLIGMATHVIGRRRHEIGVRKTLGADVRGIVVLLLRDFSSPVIAANLLAAPIALVLIRVYVRIFAQQSALALSPFALGFFITLGIAWAAVAAQTVRAARVNPATVLRYE
jgi:putative ABC transport system permease protein